MKQYQFIVPQDSDKLFPLQIQGLKSQLRIWFGLENRGSNHLRNNGNYLPIGTVS